MKNFKLGFVIIICATLILGLCCNDYRRNAVFEETEFLFDTPCSIKVFSLKDKKCVMDAFNEAARIHTMSNFFNSMSQVSKINKAKGGEAVTVSPDIIYMVELAQKISADSDGAFDISIAPVSGLWLFDEANATPPDVGEIKKALKLVGKDTLVTDKEKNTITKTYDDTKIDLGGVAKGYAADKAAEILEKNGVTNAIIDFGGNIITLGNNPKAKDKKWRIGLQKPFAPNGEYGEVLSCGPCAIATSGTYQRNFEYDGKLYHHLLDPKTGMPKEQTFASVTVSASEAALADCLATAIYILGKEDGMALAQKYNATVEFL